MDQIASVRVGFRQPLQPKTNSPILVLRGAEARNVANGILAIVREHEIPLDKGPYKPDATSVVDQFAHFFHSSDPKDIGLKVGLVNSVARGKKVPRVLPYDVALDERHIHSADEAMSPDNFVAHSLKETGNKLIASEPEELAVLLTAILRMNQLKAYLSETTRTEDDKLVSCAGVCILETSEAPVINIAVGVERHPPTRTLTVYGDPEVEEILMALRILNKGKSDAGFIDDPAIIAQILQLKGALEHSILETLLQRTRLIGTRMPSA